MKATVTLDREEIAGILMEWAEKRFVNFKGYWRVELDGCAEDGGFEARLIFPETVDAPADTGGQG